MTKRALAVLSLLLAALLVPSGPAQAAPVTVVVDNMQFEDSKVRIRIGRKVIWDFQDSVRHTTTSNQDFWDSGPRSAGEEYDHVFVSAGKYRYHCSLHPHMQGIVKVRMTADGEPDKGWLVRWATEPADVDRNYDVQYKRKSAEEWKWLAKNVVKPTGRFDAKRDGRFQLRARTSNTVAGDSSGWSPVKTLKIT